MTELEERERLAHIDQMLAHVEQLFADRDRDRQEIQFAPWALALGGATAGAALFGAGAVVVKAFLN